MNIKTGPNDRQPPEPVEEAEFRVKIEVGAHSYTGEFTAAQLNREINIFVRMMDDAGTDYPIYLNGSEWSGLVLDEKDMGEL